MKYFLSLLILNLLISCNNYNKSEIEGAQQEDTIRPVITLLGSPVDTICLRNQYEDPGAIIVDYFDEDIRCNEFKPTASGTVKPSVLGTYFIIYTGADDAGNEAIAVTRTVVVIENATKFLTGIYNASCSCTISMQGTQTPTIITDNYISAIKPGNKQHEFELNLLHIGAEKINTNGILLNRNMELGYYSRDYNYLSTLTGTLSASGKTFTIDSRCYPWDNNLTYNCRNILSNSDLNNK